MAVGEGLFEDEVVLALERRLGLQGVCDAHLLRIEEGGVPQRLVDDLLVMTSEDSSIAMVCGGAPALSAVEGLGEGQPAWNAERSRSNRVLLGSFWYSVMGALMPSDHIDRPDHGYILDGREGLFSAQASIILSRTFWAVARSRFRRPKKVAARGRGPCKSLSHRFSWSCENRTPDTTAILNKSLRQVERARASLEKCQA